MKNSEFCIFPWELKMTAKTKDVVNQTQAVTCTQGLY
jgi:hypothetical protein